jgi:neutral ceramidase
VPLLAGLLVVISGCAPVTIRVPRYQVLAPPESAGFVAGAAKVDITPPPGYPMGGHSIGGRIARGYWTRLYARAFYFQDGAGHRVVLVSCDLFAIPAALHAAVAERLKLPPDSLIVAATHTHHGPAGYMSSAVFNFGGPVPGYDGELFRRLTDGIAEAVASARENALASGDASIALHTGVALDLQRNRAIDAFYRNDAGVRAKILEASGEAGTTCPAAADIECPRYQAVDPSLEILEVRHGGQTTALLVFYAIHNTAMSHDGTLYQSDLSGRAMQQLEGGSVVAGFFNGAEGDVSPRWVAQNRDDVLRLGDRLARAVAATVKRQAAADHYPQVAAVRQVFAAVPAAGATRELTRPGSGAGELGGAEDGRTVLYGYGWHGGATHSSGRDAKVPALELYRSALFRTLQKVLGAAKNYPSEIPVSLAAIGGLSLAAIPTEMTTAEGFALRAKLQEVTGRTHVLIGLANEYIGYTASEAEYGAQDYEGASTMYGPRQGRVIGELLTAVARSEGRPSGEARAVFYHPGAKAPFRFGPEFFGERYNLPYADLEPLMPDAQHRPDDAAPRFEWNERPEFDWRARDRRVRILRETEDGWAVAEDESGGGILTELVSGRSERRWSAIWIRPRLLDAGARYAFEVRHAGRPESVTVCSRPFQPDGRVETIPMPAVEEGPCPAVR